MRQRQSSKKQRQSSKKQRQSSKKRMTGSKKRKLGKKIERRKVKSNILVLDKLMSDDKIAKKEGNYFKSKDYNHIVNYDCDVYGIVDGKQKLLAKFRKNVIPKYLTELALKNLKEPAKAYHDNRGSAAGKLDFKKVPQYVKRDKVEKISAFRVHGYYSNTTGKFVNISLGNSAQSNIIGYYDKADRNINAEKIPCRLTSFNAKEPEKFKEVVPFLSKCDNIFKNLVPDSHKKQYDVAHETDFVIADTAFSTITINYNWRTALHKDAGDFKEGFGNLIVCEEGDYKGGYTGFPQYGVCFDVRNGDFLAMDVHEWHSNTEIKKKSKDYTRLSIVCYLRKNMVKCKGIKPKIKF